MESNSPTKLERYADIQAFVRKEIQDQFPGLYQQYATKFGVASVPLHTHNGVDSPKIPNWNLIQSQVASGNITMATQQKYSIGLNIAKGVSSFRPSQIRFNGIAYHVTPPSSTPDIRALVVGDAFIGSSFYLQPLTSSSVTIGGPPQYVVQSSSNILVNNSGSGPATQAIAGEGHIVDVSFNGSVVARATIPDFGDFGLNAAPVQNGNLIVNVETLASNWTIQGNWVIF